MPRAALLLVSLALLPACGGENRRDLYMQGMKAEGDAERGPCKLMFDQELGSHVLSGDQVQDCLRKQEEALVFYDRAAALGLADGDFVQTHERARERVKKLETLLSNVREMERPEFDPVKGR